MSAGGVAGRAAWAGLAGARGRGRGAGVAGPGLPGETGSRQLRARLATPRPAAPRARGPRRGSGGPRGGAGGVAVEPAGAAPSAGWGPGGSLSWGGRLGGDLPLLLSPRASTPSGAPPQAHPERPSRVVGSGGAHGRRGGESFELGIPGSERGGCGERVGSRDSSRAWGPSGRGGRGGGRGLERTRFTREGTGSGSARSRDPKPAARLTTRREWLLL